MFRDFYVNSMGENAITSELLIGLYAAVISLNFVEKKSTEIFRCMLIYLCIVFHWQNFEFIEKLPLISYKKKV